MNTRSSLLSRESGFTLIELLTTIGIIGILSAIASNQFHQYAARAFDSRAESDLHAAITAEEAYYTDNELYAACENTECNHLLPGYLLSLDVQLEVSIRDDGTNFDAITSHPSGEKTFAYANDSGVFSWTPQT